MKLEYELQRVPQEKSGYQVPSFTEGTLRISLGEQAFLHAEDILLVEFAIVLVKWLGTVEHRGPSSLYYASMDFEEEPIFALNYNAESNSFEPDSVWASTEPRSVSVDEAVAAARSYVASLQDELSTKHGIDLAAVLEAAVGDEVPPP